MAERPDFRALCARFVDDVACLVSHGEARPGHRLILTVDVESLEELAQEARAALEAVQATPDPVLGTDRLPAAAILSAPPQRNPTAEDLQAVAKEFGLEVNDWAALGWLVVTFMAALEAPATDPVPVDRIWMIERPWEREGWLDDEGHCWFWDGVESRWIYRAWEQWSMVEVTHSLPHWALPLPEVQP